MAQNTPRVVKSHIEMDILNLINQRVQEYESYAEECFQELEDEERGNHYLSKVEALKELKQEILDKVDLHKLLGTIKIS